MGTPRHSRPKVRLETVRPWRRLVFALGLSAGAICGCSGKRTAGPSTLDVDAEAAAAKTLADFDANADGALSPSQLKAFPPLASSVAAYDADGNGALSAAELADRLAIRYRSSASLVGVQCTVTLAGRPLIGAKVLLRPAAPLAAALQPAEGVTDELGMAAPSISATELPAGVQGGGLVFPGWYHVEITHSQGSIPTRYNTATDFGWDVDPASRTGTTKHFDLKSP